MSADYVDITPCLNEADLRIVMAQRLHTLANSIQQGMTIKDFREHCENGRPIVDRTAILEEARIEQAQAVASGMKPQ